MNVRAEDESGVRIPVLTAISWNSFLNKNQTCTLNFNPKNINSTSIDARKVFSKNSLYIETDSELEKNIFLDDHYVGPNLEFELPEKSQEFSDLQIDTVRQVIVDYPSEYIKVSVFDRIIQVTDDLQIQIHQTNVNNSVQFLRCNTSFQDITKIKCTLVRTLTEITSKIRVYTHGWFREEPSFLIVQESEPNKFYQYLYTGVLQSNHSLAQVTTIIDLELSQNTLYVLDEESTQKGEIRAYSTLPKTGLRLISVIDDTYATQWGIDSANFKPLNIITHFNYVDLLLIRFPKILIAVSTQTSKPELISSKYIGSDFDPASSNYALTSNFLWNIRLDGISLYDVRDEKSFGLLYDLELFDYKFVVSQISGFQHAISNPSGFIYVVGEKERSGKSYI